MDSEKPREAPLPRRNSKVSEAPPSKGGGFEEGEQQAGSEFRKPKARESEPEAERSQGSQGGPQARAPTTGGEEGGEVWTVYRTEDGQPYYHNEATGVTAWDLPAGARWKEPDATPAAGGVNTQQYTQDQYANAAAQQQYYAQWYAQYAAYQAEYQRQFAQQYGQHYQAGPAQAPPTEPPMDFNRKGSTSSAGFTPPPFQNQQAPPSLDPNKPAAPMPAKIDAEFEDKAIVAMKREIQKEMAAMLSRKAPIAERKKALRVLQLQWHPDKNADKAEVAKSIFQFIEENKPWFLDEGVE